ncbi:hypothetical protein [Nocardiopsis tropica]|uniref:Uncharacterized protein n=1 Tax=Nocardiopsis tropica TaxID=109330 RepID=A0ABU7KMW9_9ACTN|nr:hypothetical protein [Nocardiopsis umidischolae]MEE2050640.1 hypothetical protein [Nocardiopsis umidischolae]
MGSSGKTTHANYATAPTHPAAFEEIAAEDGQEAWGEDITEIISLDHQPSLSDDTPIEALAGAALHNQEQQEDGAGDVSSEQAASQDVPETSPDAAMPIPETPPEGTAAGVPVLVGGADLQDSAATLISYHSTDDAGPREVLLTTLNEGAEAKLMDALALSGEKLIPVQVEEEVNGRLPIDEDKQLYELSSKAAISINSRLKKGEPIPPHTLDYLTTAKSAVQEVLDDPGSTQDELTMAGTYKQWLDGMQHRIDTAGQVPYDQGGKVPKINPYEHTGTALVTKMMPAPAEAAQGQLAATVRDASRIKASIDTTTGTTSWDGTSRSKANGKEYAVDLGEGYTAVYRPYAANSEGQGEYSLRGQLEIHAPQGAGHGQDLVKRLGDLHLVNRAMTTKEAEWTYLVNNIDAQGLEGKPAVKEALGKAAHMEELQLQELFHSNAHQAVGMDAEQLSGLAKQWQIEAAASCLPKKVRLVREAVATSTGFTNGSDLAASPGYDPTPKPTGGWLTWSRFDLGNNKAAMAQAWKGKSLTHSINQGKLAAILSTGVLASTERRATMGISSGLGMSEGADKYTGGASSVFMRVRNSTNVKTGPQLVWDDPLKVVDNSSLYGYNSDHFGAINPDHHHYSTTKMSKDPFKIAGFNPVGQNEVMVRHGLDLLGEHAPSRILCSTAKERTQVLKVLKAKGINHLGGKPIDQVLQ